MNSYFIYLTASSLLQYIYKYIIFSVNYFSCAFLVVNHFFSFSSATYMYETNLIWFPLRIVLSPRVPSRLSSEGTVVTVYRNCSVDQDVEKSCGLETRAGLPLATRVPLTYNFSRPVSLHVKAKLNQPVGRTGVSSFHCLFLVLNITMYLLEKCRTAKPRPLVDWPPLDMMYELVVFLRELSLSFSHDIKVIPLAAQSPWSLKQVSGFWNPFKSQSCAHPRRIG